MAVVLGVFLLAGAAARGAAERAVAAAASGLDARLPIRGFCIGAPGKAEVDRFVQFIADELAPRAVNTLILRVDFNFEYTKHPELRDSSPLSRDDVGKIVAVCRERGIRVIPQVNLLGHQSWATRLGALLRVYPDFDETPWVKMPEKYRWPNPDGLYCKSYCSLHPGVHEVVFSLVDEICEAFQTDAFHAGMDEVFYLGESRCPRCGGKDKAELFAGEVRRIRDHLAGRGRSLWIWGDRLLDGVTTGLGEWEASKNDTHRAIDLIPKDVVICDWHYDRAEQTAVYFAMKGFRVVTCPWKKQPSAVLQVQDMVKFREQSSPLLRDQFQGIVQTAWSGAGSFMREFARLKAGEKPEPGTDTESACLVRTFEEIGRFAAVAPGTASIPAPPSPQPKSKVLIVTGVDYPGHPWRETAPALRAILARDARLEPVIVENPAELGSPRLRDWDVIILHFMDWETPGPDAAARENFRAAIAGGKGLLLTHFACGAWDGGEWPEFARLAGRVWDPKLRGHDPHGTFRVEIADTAHPITRGLASFEILDELYTCLAGDAPIRVLAQSTSRVDGRNYPMAFVLDYERGRVFHTVLGHDARAYANDQGVGELLRRGCAWAAGLPPVAAAGAR